MIRIKLYFKPFDAGANFVAGYEFSNRFSAQLNAQLGLVNINPKYDGLPDRRFKSTRIRDLVFLWGIGFRRFKLPSCEGGRRCRRARGGCSLVPHC